MARWKAWEGRFAMPGSTPPAARGAAPASTPGVTLASAPSAPISKRTSRAQPSGSSARSANKEDSGMDAWKRLAVFRAELMPLDWACIDNRGRSDVGMWDAIWLNGRLATMVPETRAAPYGAIEDGALAVDGGVIAWVGPRADLPGAPETLARREIGRASCRERV